MIADTVAAAVVAVMAVVAALEAETEYDSICWSSKRWATDFRFADGGSWRGSDSHFSKSVGK